MAAPLVDGADRFQTLTDFPEKKKIVQQLELSVQEGGFAVVGPARAQYAASDWDLDRIALYLVEEHDTAPPNYVARRTRVQHEAERIRATGYEGSLMPLSYALGSFLAMLNARPGLTEQAATDSRLFADLQGELGKHPHLDKGGQVKRDLDAILSKLEPNLSKRTPGGGNEIPKPFWTTMPGILTGLAAIITAITGVYIATKDRTTLDSPKGLQTLPTLLVVEGVQLFPTEANALAQIVADVNGTEFRYPSIAGIEWAEVGPSPAPRCEQSGADTRGRFLLYSPRFPRLTDLVWTHRALTKRPIHIPRSPVRTT